MEIMNYILPAIGLFVAQTFLCLWCKNKYIRLVPTAIALGIAVYHTGIILCNLDDLWVVGFAFGYLVMTAIPPLLGVGLGWAIFVVRLLIQEVKALRS